MTAPNVALGLGGSAHFSLRKCAFPAMQALMMMAPSLPSSLPERSIDSTALMPFSSSMGSGWPLTLWQQVGA